MNKTISIIRIAILFSLGLLATLLIFCEEMDKNAGAFFLHFIVDKGLGIGLCFGIDRLYKRWSKVDPWLKSYEDKYNKVMDNSNSTQH